MGLKLKCASLVDGCSVFAITSSKGLTYNKVLFEKNRKCFVSLFTQFSYYHEQLVQMLNSGWSLNSIYWRTSLAPICCGRR